MKKLLILILALVLCVATFVACSNNEEATQTPTNAPTEAPTEVPTQNPEAAVKTAIAFVKSKHNELLKNNQTPNDFEVTGKVNACTIEWTSSKQGAGVDVVVDGDIVKIDVNEKTKEDIEYTLTAVAVAADGTKSEPLVFNLVVPEYKVISFEEYMKANEGDVVTVEGIVVGINAKSQGNSRNHIFLADASGKGGYYSYQMDEDPAKAGIKIGMTVSVSGPIAPYNGMQEIKGGTATIVDSTLKDVAPVDLTDVFTGAATSTDGAFKPYVGMLVTVKGVEIANQDLAAASSQYLYFTIGNVKSYVRTYVTDMAFGADTAAKEAAKANIDAAHAEKYGWTANVTGILVLYSGNPYIIPVSEGCFEYTEFIQKTPAEKIEAEIGAISISSKYTSETVITLPAIGKYFDDVTITWTLDGEAVTDSITLTPVVGETKKVVLVATLVCGEVTETKTIEITLSMDPISIPEVIASKDGTPVIVEGIVTEINTAWSDQYGNITFTIRDGEGNTLYIYRCNTNVTVGDAVRITGQVGSYNGSKQIAAKSVAEITGHYEEVSLTDAVAKEDGTLVIVKGTVKQIDTPWSDKYGNITFTIEDGEGNTLYIYRCNTNVEVGNVVTITGKVGSYNDAKQIAAGSYAIVETAPDEGGDEGDEALDAEGTKLEVVISDYAANQGWADDTTVKHLENVLDDVITMTIAGGNFSGKYYGGTHLRVYATDTPAGTITISAAEGYKIAQVKIKTVEGTYAFLQVEGNDAEDLSNKKVDVDASSITFNTVKNGSDGKQVRILGIEVIYTAA